MAASERPDLFSLDTHLAAMERCRRPWRGGSIHCATPEGQRYPYLYPRDLAAASRAFRRLLARGVSSGGAWEAIEQGARFVLAAQRPDGHVGQRYDLTAGDRSIYWQEDNPAHAVRVLGSYLDAADAMGQRVADRAVVVDAMERAVRYAIAETWRPGVSLFFSTTTLHESAMERGYTLWNNLAHLRALTTYLDRADREGRRAPDRERIAHVAEVLRTNVRRRFVQEGQFVRRITPEGRADRRPDVTLLSPFYFGFADLDPPALRASATRIRRELWDPELGLLQRYLPYAEDVAVHLHAGNGPWLAYSAILAQYEATVGNVGEARRILEAIADHANARGEIPEHLSTRERFRDWWAREWETGIDFRKEFDTEIMLPRVGFSRVLEELNHMAAEYNRLKGLIETEGRELLRFAVPLMWSHAEFIVALLDLEEAKTSG